MTIIISLSAEELMPERYQRIAEVDLSKHALRDIVSERSPATAEADAPARVEQIDFLLGA